MIGGGILARRYARALFGLGEAAGQTSAHLAELDAVVELAQQNPELRRVVFTPLHPRQERLGVLRGIAVRMGVHAEVRAFLMLLLEENRIALLPAIRDALRELVDRAAGRVEAQVRSARPLSEAQEEALRQALSRRMGAQVTLRTQVDPGLIGGVVARVGDLLFDGSVKTQLASLAANLRKGEA